LRDGQTQGFDALAHHKAAGMRWIFHRHAISSMIVNVINVPGFATLESKNHAPIRSHRDRPTISKLALKPMQSETRQVQISNFNRSIEPSQNVA
jgi:hypothetical protein